MSLKIVLVYNGTDIETSPLNEGDLKKTFSEPEDGRALYVQAMEGELLFTKTDFTFLQSLNQDQALRCINIPVLIKKNINGSFVNISTGYILLVDGSWDEDGCILRIKIRIEDRAEFLNEDKEVNIFDFVSEAQRLSVDLTPLTDDEDTQGFELENYEYVNTSDEWVPPYGSGTPISYGYVLIKKVVNRDYGPQDWVSGVMFCQNLTTPYIRYYYTYTRWVKWIPVADPIPPGAIDAGQTDGMGNKKISRIPAITDTPIETESNPATCVGEQTQTWTVLESSAPSEPPPVDLVDNGLSLQSILSVLLAPYNLTPKSDFFNINPENEESETINYVTGEASTTANTVIFQKSDIKRPNGINNATIFKWSIKKIVTNLVNMFNVKYDIQGTNFIIEHVSFFEKDAPWNLSGNKFIRNKYTYDIDRIPAKEEFSFMEKRPDNLALNDFNGVPIYYDLQCVKNDKGEPYGVDAITTDVPYVMNADNAEKVSDSGFVLMSCNKDDEGNLHVIRKPAIIGFYSEINNPFGWAHLHKDFWRHNRYLNAGNMNTVNTIFINPKPLKVFEKFSVPVCDINAFNPNSLVTSGLGDCVVKSAEYSLKTGMLQLTLASSTQGGGSSTTVYLRITTENERPESTGFPTFFVTVQDLVFNLYADEEGAEPLTNIPFVLGTFIINYAETQTGGSVGEPPAETVINKTVSFVPQQFTGNKAKLKVGKKSWLTDGGETIYEIDLTYQLLPNENYIIIE